MAEKGSESTMKRIFLTAVALAASIASAAADSLPRPDRPIPVEIWQGFREHIIQGQIRNRGCPDLSLAEEAGLIEEGASALDACWRTFVASDVIYLSSVDYTSIEVRHTDGVKPDAPIAERFRLYIGMLRCQSWNDARFAGPDADDEQDVLGACWDEFLPRA
jgi:hypothetical protein